MPLISISIVCGVKTLNPFVIVSCDDSATLLSVQETVWDGTLSSSAGEQFVLHAEYAGSRVSAMVGSSPSGCFQAIPLTELIWSLANILKLIIFKINRI